MAGDDENYSTVYFWIISITPSSADPSAWMFRSIGLDKSRLKIPMICNGSVTDRMLPAELLRYLTDFILPVHILKVKVKRDKKNRKN